MKCRSKRNKDTYEHTRSQCEGIKERNEIKSAENAKNLLRQTQSFYTQKHEHESDLQSHIEKMHHKRLKEKRFNEKMDEIKYIHESEISKKQAEEIAQLILRKREKAKNIHQESLVKNKEHYNKIMEKLNKSHFEDDFRLKEQQLEHRVKYEERIKNLQKNHKYQKRVKEFKNQQKEEVDISLTLNL